MTVSCEVVFHLLLPLIFLYWRDTLDPRCWSFQQFCKLVTEVRALALQEEIRMKAVLSEPLYELQQTARMIAAISNECKLKVNEDEYVESFQPILMDVVYAWSKVYLDYLQRRVPHCPFNCSG